MKIVRRISTKEILETAPDKCNSEVIVYLPKEK